MIKDSGKRVEFETGAVRDIGEGKGRCDLLPLYVISDLFDNEDVSELFKGMGVLEDRDVEPEVKYEIAKNILKTYCKWMGLSIPQVVLDVSIHFEEGAKKYGEHNWEKGIPEWSYISSATRHLLKLLDGWEDEQHGRAFVWNILAYMYTIRVN